METKGKDHFQQVGWVIYDEFIERMGCKVWNSLQLTSKQVKYYSETLDSTPDIAHVDQLCHITILLIWCHT